MLHSNQTKQVTIRVAQLRNGWVAGAGLGTCGFHPFPWTATFSETRDKALENFAKVHEKHLKGYKVNITVD